MTTQLTRFVFLPSLSAKYMQQLDVLFDTSEVYVYILTAMPKRLFFVNNRFSSSHNKGVQETIVQEIQDQPECKFSDKDIRRRYCILSVFSI